MAQQVKDPSLSMLWQVTAVVQVPSLELLHAMGVAKKKNVSSYYFPTF